MNEHEYQKNELNRFLNQNGKFFDTVKEFSQSLEEMDILEQIEWIENGSYGAGACFALQNTLRGITKRMNGKAHVGHTILHAFYGAPFTGWKRLSPKAQKSFDAAVEKWMKKKHHFAQDLII